jgi:hypothetical protein
MVVSFLGLIFIEHTYPIEPEEVFDYYYYYYYYYYYPCMKPGIMQSSICSQTATLIDLVRNSRTKFDSMKSINKA